MKTSEIELKQLSLILMDILEKNNEVFLTSGQLVKIQPQLKNGVNVRKIINRLRQKGIPIISGNSGYKYTTDIVDIFIYSEGLKNRIMEMSKAYKGIVKYMNNNLSEIKNYVI